MPGVVEQARRKRLVLIARKVRWMDGRHLKGLKLTSVAKNFVVRGLKVRLERQPMSKNEIVFFLLRLS